MKSPFQYGTLIEDDSFVNRHEDRKQIKSLLSSGINVMLISPRRWGKSSLVKKAMNELSSENPNIKVCYIDAFGIRTEQEFYRAFASAVISCTSTSVRKKLDIARKFLRNMIPSIILKDGINEYLSFDIRYEPQDEDIYTILDLPEKIAKEKGIQIIVCIDEFQQFATFPEYKSLEGKMRSVWQAQHSVSYCLYGSKKHMMMDIFNNSSTPFYRFGQLIFMEKIAEQEWVGFIITSFENTGKKITEIQASRICDIVKCHSWYVQQFCYFIWSATDNLVTDEIIDTQLRQLISTNIPMYMRDVEDLTSAQVALLRAVHNKESQLNSAKVVSLYNLGNPQTITRNKKILQDKDYIDSESGNFVFCDPIFELWFMENM